jgi:hypothetical protein
MCPWEDNGCRQQSFITSAKVHMRASTHYGWKGFLEEKQQGKLRNTHYEAAQPLLQRCARPQPTICPSSVHSPQGDPPSSVQPLALSTSSAFPWPLLCFQPSHMAPHPRAACKTHMKAIKVTGNIVVTRETTQRRVRKPPEKGTPEHIR